MAKQVDYIDRISALYAQYGVRGLSLDRLSARIGVTKRTLYNNFGTQRELLQVLVDHRLQRDRDRILSIASSPNQNAVSLQLQTLEYLAEVREGESMLFLDSLRENYPEIYSYFVARSERLIKEFFAMNIPRGRSEGLYRTDFDIDLVSSLVFRTLGVSSSALWMEGVDVAKLRRGVILFLVRGMVSISGDSVVRAAGVQ